MATRLPCGVPVSHHVSTALTCGRQLCVVSKNTLVSHRSTRLSTQHGTWQLIQHRRSLRVGHQARHLSMAAATQGRLPRGGWVPQLPPHPLQPPRDSPPEPLPAPQPQRRRPPLQRMTVTPQPATQAPPSPHQQPQSQLPSTPAPQHAQEYRPPPPGVPAAPLRPALQQVRWPRLDYLIVVEGWNDAKAVSAATESQMYVLGGAAHAADGSTIEAIRRAAFGARRGPRLRGVMVLMDPDDTGRRGRTMLDGAFPGQCWHAFIPAADATAQLATRRHQAGNLGVEHAAPDAVQRALATARLSQPERKEFDREDLVALGLFTPMGAAQAQAQENSIAPVMRELVGRLLGIGMCDGKQLVRQLNRFDFTHAELSTAVRLARGLLADKVKEQREIRERTRQRKQEAAGLQQ